MADKSISELIAAQEITPTDLLVMEQDGVAKKVSGQLLENWLLSFAGGLGGIQSVEFVSSSGLVDTYRINYSDSDVTTEFTVTNGKSIVGVSGPVKQGLVDTYTIHYSDDTTTTFTVANGAKGDTGNTIYTWWKYASAKPTLSSSSMGDEVDDWMGRYTGLKSSAPTDPMEYTWVRIKGDKGDKGDAATVVTNKTEYQTSTSGTVIPSSSWSTTIPLVTPGNYLWTRTTVQFNSGSANYIYGVSRYGIDGSGAVSTVNGVAPNAEGNVQLTAEQLQCLGLSGGTMAGSINMNGHKVTGLNDPSDDTDATRKSYVDKSNPYNHLDNSYFLHLIAQAGIGGNHGTQPYAADRWKLVTGGVSYEEGVGLTLNGTITQKLLNPPTGDVSVFVGMTSGSAQISYSDGYCTITSSGGVLAWAALYAGSYTEDNKPVYREKDYSTELINCLRYVNIQPGSHTIERLAIIMIYFPVPMVATPTITTQGTAGDNTIAVDYVTNLKFRVTCGSGETNYDFLWTAIADLEG